MKTIKQIVEERKNESWNKKIGRFLEEEIWWNIELLWEKPRYWFKEVKWFIQRGKRGYADCDAWNLDSYLEGWLPEALDKIRKDGMSYPMGMKPKEWNKILKEMAKGFRAMYDADTDENYKGAKKIEEAIKLEKKSLELFSKYFNNLWD